jgi:hypothetical protein
MLLTLDFPSTAYTFFSESLSNHCQGLRRTFSDTCTQFDVKPHQARCTANRRTLKISTSSQLREILYTESQYMPVLSSAVASCYYNFCIDGSNSPENYAYPPYKEVSKATRN